MNAPVAEFGWRRPGFTLVEIMVAVAIIGLLLSMALPAFMNARRQSLCMTCVNNLRQMATAKEVAALAEHWTPTNGPDTVGEPLYSDTISQYLKGGRRPVCPTGAECVYNAIDLDPACLSGDPTHVLARSR